MRLRLRLTGQVQMTDPGGACLTPRGRKARAVLALLGTAPDLRMTRARLQDMLWGLSPQAQGSASLRQTLREIRQALGPWRAALIAGDGWVGLDGMQVVIDLAPRDGLDGTRAEFAEDLDIPEPEFESWLRDTRLALEDAPGLPTACPQGRPRLVLSPPDGDCDAARLLARVILHEASARAGQLIPADVVAADMALDGPGIAIEADCLSPSGGPALLMVRLRDRLDGRQLWAQSYPVGSDSHGLARVSGAVALTMIQIAGQVAAADPVGRSMVYPLDDLFSFTRSRLLAADARLRHVDGPVSQALRAFLRYTMIFERHTLDPDVTLAEAEALARHACETAPADPVALSVAALMRSWRGDVAAALDLSRQACRLAPGHEMAQLALSQALTDAGRDREALLTALRAGAGPLAMIGHATWQLRLAVAHLRLGRLAEAETCAEAALARTGDCRPALRFLAALRHHRGDEAGTARALADLRRAEPDFSLTLMADPSYPVATLRHAGLLGVTRSGL